ncbi:alcohol dehydrogenase [Aspergillus ellipticus CBS 707.79]|uniref:Alcohol dehydrogenase n=1 Tax=Aspergillus ellipticus CBS 707.79 TaxID=1448320 RepID=A0A319ETF3_9EURO|nr:alcohol dehydrogenase [Aspergillus ellipticus CBS 707.79]
MTTIKPNPVLYVNEELQFFVDHREQDEPTLGDGEIFIETQFSGVNPADMLHSTLGGIYPTILGFDFCGTVRKAAPDALDQPGDVVAGMTPSGLGRPTKYGTHQQYLVALESMVFPVPPNLPAPHAACLAVVTLAGADALYNLFHFPLPDEPLDQQPPRPLLIWGASSGVGLTALQLARASGIHPILVTASPSRHDLLRSLGATHCFDYQSPTVVADIKAATADAPLQYGFDTVGADIQGVNTAQLTADCVPAEALLASVLFQSDPRFLFPLSTPNVETSFQLKGMAHPVTLPPRVADWDRVRRAVRWAVENYGNGFRLPKVTVHEGTAAEALREIRLVGEYGRGFGKVALKHSLRV